MAANYVKFLRGTPAAYAKAKKDPDTLYFITPLNSPTGKLYLGDTLIACGTGDSSQTTTELKDLLDVNLGNAVDKQILGYDATSDKWVPMSITDIVTIFNKPTETQDGTSGLVPAPKAGDENKFLRADGTWVDLNSILENKVDKQDGWTLLSPEDKSKLDKLAINEEDGTVGLSGSITAAQVQGLKDWITANRDDTPGLVSVTDAEKLSGIETGAQVNFINSVDEGIFTVTSGKLELNTIPISSVDGLETELSTLKTILNGDGEKTFGVAGDITNIYESISWHDMEDPS